MIALLTALTSYPSEFTRSLVRKSVLFWGRSMGILMHVKHFFARPVPGQPLNFSCGCSPQKCYKVLKNTRKPVVGVVGTVSKNPRLSSSTLCFRHLSNQAIHSLFHNCHNLEDWADHLRLRLCLDGGGDRTDGVLVLWLLAAALLRFLQVTVTFGTG